MKITTLPAAAFSRRPWKNGLGVTETIAADTAGDGWQDVQWSLSRTEIKEAGPFSDFSGYERWQVVTEGAGLVLETPEGEIDLRDPFRPVRYDGAFPVYARLEAGRVGVVNLIARKSEFVAEMSVLQQGAQQVSGLIVLFASCGDCQVRIDGGVHAVAKGDALRIESETPFEIASFGSHAVLATIRRCRQTSA